MLISLLAALAWGGDVVVTAEVPIEVALDGRPVAQIWDAATLRLPADVGDHKVTVLINGRPTDVNVTLAPDGSDAEVVVGRTGITTREHTPPDAAADARVELRVVGDESLRIMVDEARMRLSPGDQHVSTLTRGMHDLQVRSADGTVVFANGELDVRGTGPLVVHLSAGRAPEIIGDHTGAWRPASR